MSFKGFWTGVRRTQLTYEEFDLKIEELKARGLVYKAKTTSKVKHTGRNRKSNKRYNRRRS